MERVSHCKAWLLGIGPYRKVREMPDERMTLVEKLLNPTWRYSPNSEWADLDVEQTVETMREAAKRIAELEALSC